MLRSKVIYSKISFPGRQDHTHVVCKYSYASIGCPLVDLSSNGFLRICVITQVYVFHGETLLKGMHLPADGTGNEIWADMCPAVKIFQPKYWLGHPKNYLFLL